MGHRCVGFKAAGFARPKTPGHAVRQVVLIRGYEE